MLRIIRHPGSGSAHPRGAVLAMGNFDGLHQGHAALIKAACARAQATGKPAGVLTFALLGPPFYHFNDDAVMSTVVMRSISPRGHAGRGWRSIAA